MPEADAQPGPDGGASALADAIEGLTIGPPTSWRGLTVFPLLRSDSVDAPPYDTFGPAHAAGTFRITEASASGVVGELEAVNDGDRAVLLLDGEELIGAKQDRMINLTILVPPHSTVRIPVSCVEQGRWSMRSRTFGSSERAVFAQERARKMRDVTASLRSTGHGRTDQHAVWAAMDERLRSSGAASDTGAMSALYEQRREHVESCVAAFPAQPSQVGAVFAAGGSIVGIEMFDSPAGYHASAGKILRSHAADMPAHAAHGDGPGEGRARAFLEALLAAPRTVHRVIGGGRQIRIDCNSHVGSALVHEGRVLHLIAYGRPPGRRADATSLIRAGVMRCEAGPVFDRRPEPPAGDRVRLEDRIEGMLLGLAIGDALGNTSEGMTPAQRRGVHGEIRDYLPSRHAHGRRVGLPSDDTQLAFRTLRRLVADGTADPEAIARELCSGRIFGIGQTVKAFIRALRDEGRPWYEAGQPSAGNGALMRIPPVLLPHVATPSPALWDDAATVSMITHNDPAAIGSSVAFVDVLWRLLSHAHPPPRGWWLDTFVHTLRDVEGDAPRYSPRAPRMGGPTSLWSFTARHVGAALAAETGTAAACDGWYSGAYLLETVPSVVYILERHAHDPEEAIVRAVNDTRDSDTIAAIAGAAVGALHGRSGLPVRWIDGLLGRTGENDDGAVFDLVRSATQRFLSR